MLMRCLIVLLAAVVPAFAASQPGALELASKERVRAGLIALTPDPRLAIAAEMQARHMAGRRQISHEGPNGSTVLERVRASGYSGCSMAENVAAGQTTAQEVMSSWMASAGHRQNILNGKLVHGAVAAVRDDSGRLWWAMVLAGPC
ncbi:MAG: CAP domain-containing protein [Pseudomonadota bacterium]